MQLLFRLLLCRAGRLSVLAAETVDTACRIQKFLLAGIERMALRANFDHDRVFRGRAGFKLAAARALDHDLIILGMNIRFHVVLSC